MSDRITALRSAAIGTFFVTLMLCAAPADARQSIVANDPVTLSPPEPKTAPPAQSPPAGSAQSPSTANAKDASPAPLITLPPALRTPGPLFDSKQSGGAASPLLTIHESPANQVASADAAGAASKSSVESKPLGRPNGALSVRPTEVANATDSGLLGSLDPRRNEFTRVIGALAVVIGLLLLTRSLMRRLGGANFGAGAAQPSGVVEILARFPIARGQQFIILKLARRIILLHQSGTSMTALSELTDPDEVASLLARMEAGASGRGAAKFKAALSEFEAEHHALVNDAGPARVRRALLPEMDTEIVDLTRGRGLGNRIGSLFGLAQEDRNVNRRVRFRWSAIAAAVACALALSAGAAAQTLDPSSAGEINPIGVLEGATQAVPGMQGGLSSAMNIVLLLTVLSLAPALLVLCTCFTRMAIVLGLLRQALGTQGLPPSQVIVGLSLFITMVVMAPTAERMYKQGIGPYMRGEQKDYTVAWDQSKQPLRDFMFAQIEASGNWSGVYMMLNYRGIDTSHPEVLTRGDVDMLSLVPAYILSELKVAFLMGFRIYLPFLVIDMVISSMLISMGMLMLPPVLISLPFKLLLFVLVDGWQLVVGSLMTSVVQPWPGVTS